jgi:hypothetical protein
VAHLIEFVRWVQSIGGRVNASCGFHVHVGLTGLIADTGLDQAEYLERLTRLASFNSTALYAQTGSFLRSRNHFCAALTDNRYRAAVARVRRSKSLTHVATTSRYQLLNLTNVTRTGTVEFRCFAGTLNLQKILLHVFSAIAIGVIARRTKTSTKWDNRPWNGVDSVTNFLKVRPMLRVVDAAPFHEHWRSMVAVGLQMAAKYDEQAPALTPAVAA